MPNSNFIDHTESVPPSSRLALVSIDSHVSPQVSDYGPYCEAKYRAELEEFTAGMDQHLLRRNNFGEGESTPRQERYLSKAEEFGSDELNSDPAIRLKHMDDDGISVEVVYHGGQNYQPIPFFSRYLNDTFSQDIPTSPNGAELRAAGIRMYNRWLADWVSIAPERLIGLAHVPIWDLEATLVEIKAASDAGLRGVNLPAPRREIPGYNESKWDPLWELCCTLNLAVHTHGGGGDVYPCAGPAEYTLKQLEIPFSARRGLGQLVFGQVFERFPELYLVLSEQFGTWIREYLANFDSLYYSLHAQRTVPYIQDVLPSEPSKYFYSNVYVGASFMSREEAAEAVEYGYWKNMLWGRDFPHPEGTWPYTRESVRKTFAGLPELAVRGMLGENAIGVLGLDREKILTIADKIGPTLQEVNEPLDELPPIITSLGFREHGMWS